ncbi:hypothetical protein QL285_094717 [Trifolium repens]|nr:hypothetical protein QL285_094717 [Trifolium repens]
MMKSSCCDVKIQFNFITDPVHFISLGAKFCHRAAMRSIVLRCKDFLQISWRTSSSHRGTMRAIVLRWNADFLHFLGFFLSFCILDSVLMLFSAFVGFSSYLGLSWSFYY